MLGQGRRRFVENNDLRVKRQRPGNCDHMALGDAQGFQRRAGVNLHLQTGEDRLRPAVHFRPVELFENAFIQILTDKNVFGDRQLIEQDGLLVNRGDAHLMRRVGGRQLYRNGFVEDLALVGLVDAGHHFDQRRFARAVFTDQSGDFAGPEFKLHVLKRAYTRENLGDAIERQ